MRRRSLLKSTTKVFARSLSFHIVTKHCIRHRLKVLFCFLVLALAPDKLLIAITNQTTFSADRLSPAITNQTTNSDHSLSQNRQQSFTLLKIGLALTTYQDRLALEWPWVFHEKPDFSYLFKLWHVHCYTPAVSVFWNSALVCYKKQFVEIQLSTRENMLGSSAAWCRLTWRLLSLEIRTMQYLKRSDRVMPAVTIKNLTQFIVNNVCVAPKPFSWEWENRHKAVVADTELSIHRLYTWFKIQQLPLSRIILYQKTTVKRYVCPAMCSFSILLTNVWSSCFFNKHPQTSSCHYDGHHIRELYSNHLSFQSLSFSRTIHLRSRPPTVHLRSHWVWF